MLPASPCANSSPEKIQPAAAPMVKNGDAFMRHRSLGLRVSEASEKDTAR